MIEKAKPPEWSPRVPRYKIRRLYQSDAQGIQDNDLADQVGFALLTRCESFLEANQAVQGQAVCPVCSCLIPHGGQKEELLTCEACGWTLSWGAYYKTIQGKQLSGAAPVIRLFKDFIHHFSAAHSYQEKMLQIDRLIHGFHWHQKYGATRPVAINLIDGRLSDVLQFLDQLHEGEDISPRLRGLREQWQENSQSVRDWLDKQV